MSELFWLVFIYVCMLPVLPILLGVSLSNAKPKKSIVLGVTLPYTQHTNPEVQALCARYKKQVLWAAAVLFLLSLPALWLRPFTLGFAWLMMWILIVIAGINLPFILANRRLKALKKAHGWAMPAAGHTVVDLDLAAQPAKPVHPAWFLPPLIAAFVPVGLALAQQPVSGWQVFAFAASALIVPLCFGLYRYSFRQRGEVVGENSALNQTLTRVRRAAWTRCWLAAAWLSGAFALLLWWLYASFWGLMLLTLGYTLALIFVVMNAEFSARKAQAALVQQDGLVTADEDDYWLWGMFYANPHDSHFMVNERVGVGMTTNFAHPAGRAIMALTAVAILSIPIMCIWMLRLEFTPVGLAVQGGALEASHLGVKYRLPLDELEDVRLEESIALRGRVAGAGFDNACTGKFNVEGQGTCEICLNPKAPPYLRIEAGGKTYYFGDNNPARTREVFAALTEANAAP